MIFISAGHHLNDPGAISGKYKESIEMMEFRDLVAKALKSKNVSFIQDKDYETLSEYLKRIQTGSGSVVCEFHLNASSNRSATGTETIVRNRPKAMEYAMAKDLSKIVHSRMGIPLRGQDGVKTESQTARKSLALMKESGLVALMEICFISNPNDMKLFQSNKKGIAEDIANVLIKYEKMF